MIPSINQNCHYTQGMDSLYQEVEEGSTFDDPLSCSSDDDEFLEDDDELVLSFGSLDVAAGLNLELFGP